MHKRKVEPNSVTWPDYTQKYAIGNTQASSSIGITTQNQWADCTPLARFWLLATQSWLVRTPSSAHQTRWLWSGRKVSGETRTRKRRLNQKCRRVKKITDAEHLSLRLARRQVDWPRTTCPGLVREMAKVMKLKIHELFRCWSRFINCSSNKVHETAQYIIIIKNTYSVVFISLRSPIHS